MTQFIKIASSADDRFEFDALHADPVGNRRGSVIVVQEIFGIDDYVKADVERWSQNGFEVLAPSMYDRIEKGFHAAHDEAGAARDPLDQERIILAGLGRILFHVA